jgi:CheY-like chemotaxis protein
MRILFVDDEKYRHDTFRKNSVGHHVDYAYNAETALAFLTEHCYDVVCLDHDMSIETQNQLLTGEKDGRYIVKELIRLKPEISKETVFVVHSLNYAGSREMVASLKEAGYSAKAIPFAWKVQI